MRLAGDAGTHPLRATTFTPGKLSVSQRVTRLNQSVTPRSLAPGWQEAFLGCQSCLLHALFVNRDKGGMPF
jgi:hypothetical protein